MRKTAKVFMTGRSQAVRLPAEFRFDGKEVFIRKDEKTGENGLGCEGEQLAVSVITEAEMLHGKALKPGSWRLAQAIQVTLAGLTVLQWSSDAAAAYATLRAENQRRGIAVGTLDS